MVAKKSNKADCSCDKTMLLGRVLIAAFFINAIYNKITGFSGVSAYADTAWLIGGIIPGELLIVVAIIMMTVGSISVLLGWKMEMGAWILAIYVLLTVLFFHNFLADSGQLGAGLKNLALAGALLVACTGNPGKYVYKG